MLAAEAGAPDALESLDTIFVDALADWQAIADPVTAPILEIMNSASSFEEALKMLETRRPDVSKLADRLGRLTAIARGIGDIADDAMKRGQIAVPHEVTSYFDGKTNAPAFSWLDVWAEEHAYKFTVAKAVELDVLNAFRSTVSAANTGGQGYDSWKPMIAKELSKLGWWQPRMVSDRKTICLTAWLISPAIVA